MNPVTEPVKITSLELENVKRIRACAITPTQNGLTVIGGRNNQGKTSVTRAEWFDGGREGMKPALVFITPAVNYSGEPEAELHGVRYRIYRTYRKRDTDEVELHLEEKAGVAHG